MTIDGEKKRENAKTSKLWGEIKKKTFVVNVSMAAERFTTGGDLSG